MSTINSYPSIYNLGHRNISELFFDPVIVEEKLDGSQLSFGIIDGVLGIRSKNTQLNTADPEKMFRKAVDAISNLTPLLKPNVIYRGEYFESPKHNVIQYDRIPTNHIILFDICDQHGNYWNSLDDKHEEADRIGLEYVPMIFHGLVTTVDQFNEIVEKTSILGGSAMEGVVIKNFWRFGPDKKPLFGKFVRASFKEVLNKEFKKNNPSQTDVLQNLILQLRTPARWQKGVQHLRDDGKLKGTPEDIGLLMKEIPQDVLKECEEMIKEELFAWAWPKIKRGVISGVPEWYKERLENVKSNDNLQ